MDFMSENHPLYAGRPGLPDGVVEDGRAVGSDDGQLFDAAEAGAQATCQQQQACPRHARCRLSRPLS